jgi:hypothetical protein
MVNGLVTGDIQSTSTTGEVKGESSPFSPGEVLRAYVLDVSGPNSVSLRIKGRFIEAVTEAPLEKDSAVLVKVLDASDSGGQLRLQLLKYSADAGRPEGSEAPGLENLRGLLSDLAEPASAGAYAAEGAGDLLESLFKALPRDGASLPKDVRAQLQDLLLESLAETTGKLGGAGERLGALLSALENHGNPDLAHLSEIIPKGALVDMENITGASLQARIENGGTGLEAKLRALALEESDPPKSAGSDSTGKPIPLAITLGKEDLKAALGALRSLLKGDDAWSRMRSSPAGSAEEASKLASGLPDSKGLLKNVESLLNDIQTFQLLSKATGSYYSFLPVAWSELKEGHIAFKKGGGNQRGPSCYCMINLDLARCGKLAVMIFLQNGDFFTSFKAEDPGFRKALENRSGELRGLFASHGLRLKSVTVLGPEDAALAPFERLENPDALIDLRV